MRNFLNAMALSLVRSRSPGVIIVPDKDRHELRSAMRLLTQHVDVNAEPAFIRTDRDLEEYVFEESHHRPIVHLNAENISHETQLEAVQYWSQPSHLRPAITVFVVSRDPGEIYQDKIWIQSFREMVHMPTFRWPASQTRLKTPKHRLGFFLEVLQEVGSKQKPSGVKIDPGAQAFLLEQFFSRYAPRYTGNYVKLAMDLITTMVTAGENAITTKVVLSLTDPSHEWALG